MNIPIYRAKKINSNEYVEGFLHSETLEYIQGGEMSQDQYNTKEEEWFIMSNNGFNNDLIDPSTLAIHFTDMLDSQGNKIFASLDEYMLKGASILENYMFQGDYKIQHAVYSEGCICVMDKDGEKYNIYENGHQLKIIGIQE